MVRVPPKLIKALMLMAPNRFAGFSELPPLEVGLGVVLQVVADHNTEQTWVLGVHEEGAPEGYGPTASVLVAPGYDKLWGVYGRAHPADALTPLGESENLATAFELAIVKLVAGWRQ